HKPNVRQEEEGIHKTDGRVAKYKDDISHAENQLAVTLLYIIQYSKQSSVAYIILVCDGIWDVINNQQVAKFVFSNKISSNILQFIVSQLLDEWLLLYSKDIYQGLLPLYIALPSALAEFSSFYVTNEMVKSICCAMCTIPTDYILSNNLKPLFHSDDNESTLSEPIQTVFNYLYRLLCLTPNRPLQYSAYHLLNKLLPHISSTLILKTNNETIAEDNKTCRLPGSMLEALERTENTIKQLLNENDFVEEHLLDDHGHEIISERSPTIVVTDKEHIIIGELLNYKLLLNLINCYLSVEQRYTYKLMLQEKKLVDRFLLIALGLIPANPVYNDPLSMQVSSITKKLTHSKSMFENDIQLNPNGKLRRKQ
ncbi:unnamed protein product, partial [Rotaria sp. Silwood2]